ncbi:hypothetical protein RI367_004952 [Sorochytrium milnesiophthora]
MPGNNDAAAGNRHEGPHAPGDVLLGICSGSISINQTGYSEWKTTAQQWQQNHPMGGNNDHYEGPEETQGHNHTGGKHGHDHHEHKGRWLFSFYNATQAFPGLCSGLMGGQGSGSATAAPTTATPV